MTCKCTIIEEAKGTVDTRLEKLRGRGLVRTETGDLSSDEGWIPAIETKVTKVGLYGSPWNSGDFLLVGRDGSKIGESQNNRFLA